MRLDLIPSITERPLDAVPTQLRIKGDRPARRTVLRALTVGALAATLVPFDWVLARRSAAAGGPATEWSTRCDTDYTPWSNNWPSGGWAACYGGRRVGKYGCNSYEWHREGYYTVGSYRYYSARVESCDARNAWRWSAGGYRFRCSDATTTSYTDHGNVDWTGLTVARCVL